MHMNLNFEHVHRWHIGLDQKCRFIFWGNRFELFEFWVEEISFAHWGVLWSVNLGGMEIQISMVEVLIFHSCLGFYT